MVNWKQNMIRLALVKTLDTIEHFPPVLNLTRSLDFYPYEMKKPFDLQFLYWIGIDIP